MPAKAPVPASAAKLSLSQIITALKSACRRNVADKAAGIQATLRAEQLHQPPAVTTVYASTVRSAIAVLTVLGEQIKALQEQVEDRFGSHPAAAYPCSLVWGAA
ncbi:hypothetical protein [Streptosporangium roseum]|uniref:hypothetical protein n=1 Tax=Streptosporangium roseum TaxID=2001 RepID=UPI003329DA66